MDSLPDDRAYYEIRIPGNANEAPVSITEESLFLADDESQNRQNPEGVQCMWRFHVGKIK